MNHKSFFSWPKLVLGGVVVGVLVAAQVSCSSAPVAPAAQQTVPANAGATARVVPPKPLADLRTGEEVSQFLVATLQSASTGADEVPFIQQKLHQWEGQFRIILNSTYHPDSRTALTSPGEQEGEPMIMFAVPAIQDRSKVESPAQLRETLLFSIVHELVHIERGIPELQACANDDNCIRAEEARTWGLCILNIVPVLQERHRPIPFNDGERLTRAYHFLTEQARSDVTSTTWLRYCQEHLLQNYGLPSFSPEDIQPNDLQHPRASGGGFFLPKVTRGRRSARECL